MPSDHTDPRNLAPDPVAWAERRAEQSRAFDAIGERYDEAFPNKEGQEDCVRRLLDSLAPGAHVLDLGSGTGLPTARQLVNAGARVTGFEFSQGMLDLARSNVPEAEFRQADILDLDPVETSYDAIVAFFSLLCLPKDRIADALGRVRASLAPGGLLCLSMVEADLDDVPISFLGSAIRVSGYPRDELRRVVTDAGLIIEDERTVSYAPEDEGAHPEVQIFLTCRRGA
ncbi:class I SAM-dependent methyltransferase [Nocardiopsis sp. MG754419]|uniref:class I SAM-dependent DNA methyltransferase n=1 Tax=Nocardiopsis sp. MG754419 TaxID=2259865 RepID=UPI001BA46282|nr:class I SAM-dependent methyltransferase [Nocardiopsis sp. MG754419]MBR8743418.1 SAM-dependent methyltransferase [Nocardiopsis sp. MG754419]